MSRKFWLAGVVALTAALVGAPAAYASLQVPGQHRPAVAVQVHGLRPAVGARLPRTRLPHLAASKTVLSANWSGFAAVAVRGQHIRFVSADFTLPSVNCTRSPLGKSGFAFAAHWAGLDGYNDATAEQAGASAYCDSTGTPSYYVWYEMYPLAPVAFTGVSPGDAISVSVYFNGSVYRLILTDLTTGAFFDTDQACPAGSKCRNASAEVITEDPGGAVSNGVNLADFGMTNYTGIRVTSGSGKHGTLAAKRGYWTSSQILMQDARGTKMAIPSALYGGRGFNVTWRSAT